MFMKAPSASPLVALLFHYHLGTVLACIWDGYAETDTATAPAVHTTVQDFIQVCPLAAAAIYIHL